MHSHVKSGAIYHNYSISPNISSSFFDFSSLSLSFRRFYAPILLHRSVGNGVITTTLPTRSARLLTIFPLFSRAFAPLPTVIAGSYRKARACVSYVTWPRALRYELLTLISSLAGGHGGPSEGGWRSGRGHDSFSQGGKRLSAMDIGGWASGSATPYRSLRHAYLQPLEQ